MNKRTEVTQQLCDHARILLAGGATGTKAAEILGIGESTVYRMKKAGFSAEKYNENKEKEQQGRLTADPVKMEIQQAELPGQIRMEMPEDPDTQFDRNLRNVLEKLTNNSATFQEAMKEIREEKEKLTFAAMEHRDSRIRINNLVTIIRDALNQIMKEL